MLRQRLRRGALLLLAALAAPWLVLGVLAALTPLPPELRDARHAPSTRLLDRHGALLRHVRSGDGQLGLPLSLAEMGPLLPQALIAAEDRRFYWHPGVDPLAVARAALSNITSGRIVSGASTITQQLARTLVPRPRTLRGKVSEMALALRIEASLSKEQILEEYLNRAPFGPQLRGVEGSARSYFDKPARALSLAEAALIAGLPQGPTLRDPRRAPARALARRDEVLTRMASAGMVTEEQARRAKAEPLSLTSYRPGYPAPHLTQSLLSGALLRATGVAEPASRPSVIETTIEPALQRETETQVAQIVNQLATQSVTAAAAVVLDNASGEILAYVGSPGVSSQHKLGSNDGVLARRQPGSSLKPFVYELAMERRGWSVAELLPDIDLRLPAAQGEFRPGNYDGRFHGPVRLREALANSYNVPAVWTASVLGPTLVLDRLRAIGFASLDQPAEYYGAAIALGDGEVTLLELAAAYATLARGGSYLTPSAVRSLDTPQGGRVAPRRPEPVQLLDAAAVALITDVLSDPKARLSSFGEQTALDLPFPTAAKTGTSKGYRDNITVGYTHEITVAVWVGNFDGSPMQGVSGITGAGPLFRAIMSAAMVGRTPAPLIDPAVHLVEAEVCALSGRRPSPACPHRKTERFASQPPEERCDMHVLTQVDVQSGLLADRDCPGASPRPKVFERYPQMFQSWAEAARRPLEPVAYDAHCPDRPAPSRAAQAQLRITAPLDGSVYLHDPGTSAVQAIGVRIEAPANTKELRLLLDGRARILRPPFSLSLPLIPGEHRLSAEGPHGITSDVVTFTVQ